MTSMSDSSCSKSSEGEAPTKIALALPIIDNQHQHLLDPLESLSVQTETGVTYSPDNSVTNLAHHLRRVRPLYTTVRRIAVDWIEALAEEWTFGPAQMFVELCGNACLVADSRGMPPEGNEREYEFPVHGAPGVAMRPETLAWTCLMAGAARERNQRPRSTGPATDDWHISDQDILDWRSLIKILGLPLKRSPLPLECLRVTQRITKLLPRKLIEQLSDLARTEGAVPDEHVRRDVVDALNAVMEGSDLGHFPPDSGLDRLRIAPEIRYAGYLPAPERLRLNRYLLEIGFLKLRRLPPGSYPDLAVRQAPLSPYIDLGLVGLPVYARKASRLNGVVYLQGDGPTAERRRAGDRIG